MCVDINVALPTIYKFLLFYPLRCGCFLVLFWTLIRSLTCCISLAIFIPEVLIHGISSFSHYLLATKETILFEYPFNAYNVYIAFLFLLLTEALLFLYAAVHLRTGIVDKNPKELRAYLLCRLFTWTNELFGLLLLSVINGVLIGWYLLCLVFIILELYGFVATYSYYRELLEEEHQQKKILQG